MAERPQALANALVVLLGAVLGLMLCFGDVARLHGIKISGSAVLGRDFINVWQGGFLARSHQVDAIYDVHRYMAIIGGRFGIHDLYAYSYPPHSLLPAAFFSLFPYLVALTLWTLAGLALFYHAARPYLVDARLPPLLALALPAGLVNIWAGHYGFLIGALALYGWRFADDRPRLAGVFFGLMTIKPHLGLLVALALLLQRRWAVIGYAAATFMTLFIVSGACFGFQTWQTYVTHTLGFHADLFTRGVASFHGMMPTTSAALLQLGLPSILVKAAQAITAVYAIVITVLAVRREVSARDLGLIASTAIFLILPYAFNYDMTVVSLAIAITVARAGLSLGAVSRVLLGLGYLLPLLLSPGQHAILFAPLVLAGVLWIQLRTASDDRALQALAPAQQAQA